MSIQLRISPKGGGKTAQRSHTPVSLPEPEHEPIIAVDGLCISYGSKAALQDVKLDIRPGVVTALMGPSGCGKSSFLMALNRLTDLIQGCRVEGSVRIEGIETREPGYDPAHLRLGMGMIFQKPNPFPLSIRANLHLPLREQGVRGRSRRDEVAEQVLQKTGLWEEVWDRLDRPALSLSGGQQQRLCIARALTLRPRILLMDEPCSALDPMATEIIEGLIHRMRGDFTVVIVTHNLFQARRVADEAAVFWNREGTGKLIEAGTCSEVFTRPRDPDTAAFVRGHRG